MAHHNRAARRHHHARMIARTRRFLATYAWSHLGEEGRVLRRAENRQVCSCHACGNQRRHYGPSIAERRDPSVLLGDAGDA